MRLDHVCYAAEADGVHETAARLGAALGVEPVDVGVHPRFGTRNVILPLAGGHYVEVLGALEHPSVERVPFSRCVRERMGTGGGWFGWVVEVTDLALAERRLGREPMRGNRRGPNGVELRWRQIGVNGLGVDPQIPFLVEWEGDRDQHPSALASSEVRMITVRLAGDPTRVCDWLGKPACRPLADVVIEWAAPRGTPGLLAVGFSTPHGPVLL